ncbi:MAG: PorP/SprF family type IX secretion system membrane protein [Flavobacteriaceae bacterium]
MKRLLQIHIALLSCMAWSQGLELPPDFRQHTLTEYNSSFLNPVFSLNRNNPQSVALWTRWQWQSIDADPSTIFLNYSRRLKKESAGGIAFFQHNTSYYVQRGGAFNYAYGLDLKNNAQIAFGVNLYAYQRKIADERLLMNPNPPVPLSSSSDFIIQMAPGLQFSVGRFNTGISVENLVDYNISVGEKVSQPGEKIYYGHAGFEVPITAFGTTENSYIRPVVYLKSIPGYDEQLGLNTLVSTSKFYTQVGYSTFYGFSAGLGGRFMKKISIGALMEFGTRSELDGVDPSIEIAASFFIGPQFQEEELPEEEEEEELAQKTEEEIAKEIAEEERRKEAELLAAAALAREAELAHQREEERLAEEARIAREEFVRDSIAAVQEQAELARIAAEKETAPKEDEKYQEATAEEGLQPGYYLVANVFGTQRYYEAFMKTLSQQGLDPKSFYRAANKYNYVYLQRYDSIQEARRARDSKFNGRYEGDTWIFRMLPK